MIIDHGYVVRHQGEKREEKRPFMSGPPAPNPSIMIIVPPVSLFKSLVSYSLALQVTIISLPFISPIHLWCVQRPVDIDPPDLTLPPVVSR